MVKIRYFSVYSDFKTSLLSRILILFSIIFLTISISFTLINYFGGNNSDGIIGDLIVLSQSSLIDISFALSILCAGLGGIALFFHRQFKKLALIAEEIENSECKKD